MEYYGDYVYVDGIYVRSKAVPELTGTNVYEVVRLIEGKLLFWEEHYARLQHSLISYGITDVLQDFEFKSIFQSLIQKNKTRNINIRINIYLNETTNIHVGMIPSFYPSDELYDTGVKTCLFQAERSNPALKVVQSNLQKEVLDIKAQKKVYEVLLVNRNNCVTEGSRSNLFFIKGNRVYTAPCKDVLGGITRLKIIEACKWATIPVVEQEISVGELELFDACFISGTSPKVLPICAIDSIVYQTKNKLLQTIMDRYNIMINSVLY